jgi:hypothetical protein
MLLEAVRRGLPVGSGRTYEFKIRPAVAHATKIPPRPRPAPP